MKTSARCRVCGLVMDEVPKDGKCPSCGAEIRYEWKVVRWTETSPHS